MAAELGNLKIGLGVDSKGLKSGLNSATKDINKFSSAIGRIGGGLALGALAVQAGEFAEEMSNLGTKVRNVGQAFARFQGSVKLMEDLKRSTGGAVDELTLMEQAVKATNLGIDQNQLAKFFEFATIRAAETGESVDYLVTSIVNGVGRRSPLILDNLGIGVTKLGKDFRSSADAAQIVSDIIDEELGKSTLTVENAVLASAKLAASWREFKIELSETFEGPGTAALNWLDEMVKLMTDFVNVAQGDPLSGAFESLSTSGKADYLRDQIAAVNDFIIAAREAGDAASVAEWLKVRAGLSNDLKDIEAQLMVIKDGRDAFEQSMVGYGEDVVKYVKTWKEELADFMPSVQETLDPSILLDSKILSDVDIQIDGINQSVWELVGASAHAKDIWMEMMREMENFQPAVKLDSVIEEVNNLSGALEALISGSISNLATALGDALSGGFDDGGFLRTLGQFMQSFGESLIAIGVGSLGLKAAIKNPFAAIAAGAGLVALGQIIKNTAQNASSNLGAISRGATISQSGGDIGGFGREQEQPEINIYLNGQKLTQGLQRQELYNGRTGG